MKILAIVGSLRKESYNRQLALARAEAVGMLPNLKFWNMRIFRF
jgi:hypothetical protein